MKHLKSLLFCGLVATAFAGQAEAQTAAANMKSPDGKSMGIVLLMQTPHGVLVKAQLTGIPKGGHGFHIHQTGSCAPDFKAAGGHFNPAKKGHGITNKTGMHAGDQPNIYAVDVGTATAEFLNTNITLIDGPNGVFDKDGSAVIIHAKPDSHRADPGAGGRIACGVIKK